VNYEGGRLSDEVKRRRESTRFNAISPERVIRIAEIDCAHFRLVGRGWIYCNALDWMYCLYSKKPCSFWRSTKERVVNETDNI